MCVGVAASISAPRDGRCCAPGAGVPGGCELVGGGARSLTQVLTAESFLSPTPGYNLGSPVLLSLSFVRYVTSP